VPNNHRLVADIRPLATEVPAADFHTIGRLNIKPSKPFLVPVNADYYLCGPDALVRAISARLTA
jgi:hypothetical protein